MKVAGFKNLGTFIYRIRTFIFYYMMHKLTIWDYYYYKWFKSSRVFYFNGKTYNYFCHRYNTTWKNERAVEIPIIWEIVKKNNGKKILEVGNVFSNYFTVIHDIVDKYEIADDVINCDVCEFKPSKGYDLIVSISTLEHVGWDENPREPMKILHAIENLKNLLNNNGRIIVTLPLGYNHVMDKFLNEGKLEFTEIHSLKRITNDNQWVEVKWGDIINARYDYPFNSANGLAIGIINK